MADAPAYLCVIGDVMTDVVVRDASITRAPGATNQLAVALDAGSDVPAAISILPGGSAANTAAWCGWLGRATTFIGRVGTDLADWHRTCLAAHGVQCRFDVDPVASSGVTVAFRDGAGERSFLTDVGANHGDLDDSALDVVGNAAWVHASAYALMREPPAAGAGRMGFRDVWSAAIASTTPCSVDLASVTPLRAFGPSRLAQLLRGVTCVFANEAEAATMLDSDGRGGWDASETAMILADKLGAEVVVKCGANGVWVARDGRSWSCAALELDAESLARGDSIGAGDAFVAGYLHARLRGDDVAHCAAAGTSTAARARACRGGRPPSAAS